jgi:hypothetical protein
VRWIGETRVTTPPRDNQWLDFANFANFALNEQKCHRRGRREYNRIAVWLVRAFVALAVAGTLLSGQSLRRDDRSLFEGIWNSATATPLERPPQLKDTAYFTPDEAAAWEREVARGNEEPPSQPATRGTGTGTYNTFFREFGTRTVKTRRTSIITHPPDGRIPALTPVAAETKRRRVEGLRNPAGTRGTRASRSVPRLRHGWPAHAALLI